MPTNTIEVRDLSADETRVLQGRIWERFAVGAPEPAVRVMRYNRRPVAYMLSPAQFEKIRDVCPELRVLEVDPGEHGIQLIDDGKEADV